MVEEKAGQNCVLDPEAKEFEIAYKGQEVAVDYVTMELFQSVSTHHRFKIKVNYRPDKPSVWAIGPDVIFKQLGEKVSIIMTHHESGEKTEFHGLISFPSHCRAMVALRFLRT